MSEYLQSARAALAMDRKGKTVAEIKANLGLRYAHEVHNRLLVARKEETFHEPNITVDELALIMGIGKAQLRQLDHGETCNPKLKYCGGRFWLRGKAERIARKRLARHRKGEDPNGRGTGFNLLHPYNGYVCLTPAGWALFWSTLSEQERDD